MILKKMIICLARVGLLLSSSAPKGMYRERIAEDYGL